MRLSNAHPFTENGLVKLKDQNWLDKQRVAGKIAAATLVLLSDQIKNRTHNTYAELNEMAELYIISKGGIPTFKNYKGTFPAGVCISVNKELVHGIPKNVKPEDGDVVSFDLGVTYEGAIADTAITCIYGTPKTERHVDLIKSTEESLMRGIQAIAVEKRLGCIGYAISKYAKGKGYGIINNYGGHGLDWNQPHASPFVANKANEDEGIRIQAGLAIAIEPMLVLGSTTTRVLSDGWTVATDDIGAHFEHSIFVHEDHVEIITDRSKVCSSDS